MHHFKLPWVYNLLMEMRLIRIHGNLEKHVDMSVAYMIYRVITFRLEWIWLAILNHPRGVIHVWRWTYIMLLDRNCLDSEADRDKPRELSARRCKFFVLPCFCSNFPCVILSLYSLIMVSFCSQTRRHKLVSLIIISLL